MPDHDKTIYKTCREAAGYTQERAAELLNLSVRQLARFEAGELIPGDDIAYVSTCDRDSTDAGEPLYLGPAAAGCRLLPYQHESGGTKLEPGKPDRVLYSFHSE